MDDLAKAFEALGEALGDLSATMNEAADVFAKAFQIGFSKIDIDAEINAIRENPSLNRFQKWRHIRELKKLKKEMEREDENETDNL